MDNYELLFADLEDYRLPDGTRAQALWIEPVEGETFLPYWVLVPYDNPHDANAWHVQYEVRRDGQIAAVRWAGERAIRRIGELPTPELIERGYSDLMVDDLQPA